MKTFERLAFISFWIHIIYVPLIMIGFPVSVVLVAKGLIAKSFFETGWFPVIHSIMAIFIFFRFYIVFGSGINLIDILTPFYFCFF